ncbi:unnamed protein product [Clonostachys rhizophaga]|uniref:Uncharacterized protein n=1 Tax=Clonostachys rhizophaga TaxID=160324 RepID=A0A9N9YCE1_9HYPO|nr:unnamed protein product [Clonostachys rhizophaga]
MNFIIGKNEDDEFKKLTPHWIRMTRFLELEDGLRSRHGKYPWLWCLLTVHQEFDSRLAKAASLKPLTDQFELYPLKTIQRVALFRQDVKTQDLTHAFLAFLASRQESYRLCWYFIQRSLQAQFKSLEEPTEIHSSGGWNDYEAGYSFKGENFDDSPALTSQDKALAEQVRNFAIKFQEDYANIRNRKITASEPIADKLQDIFHQAKKSWPKEIDDIWKFLGDIMELEPSDTKYHQRKYENAFALTALLEANFCMFARMDTGTQAITTWPEAFQRLKLSAEERSSKWGAIYQEIETLRGTIEEQRQIITCLEYRHILEHLPPDRVPGKGGPKWMNLWEEVVNQELDLQLLGNFGPRALTPLFEKKVKDLTRARLQAITNEINRQITVAQANGRLPAKPMNIAQEINAAPNNIYGGVKVPYKEWPGYRRGEDMYSDLSEMIHGYGKKYEFQATNWPKLERHILEWLKPSSAAARDGEEIIWEDERLEKKIR